MKPDLGSLMKQAQKMQAQMQKAQEELAGLEVTGEAGGGLVKICMTCKHEVRKLTIDPSLLGDDREMITAKILTDPCSDGARPIGATEDMVDANTEQATFHL